MSQPAPSTPESAHITAFPAGDPATTSQVSSQEALRTPISPIEVQETPDVISAEDESKYPTGFRFTMIMVSLMLGLVIIGLDGSVISTAVPSITNDFRTIADIGWYFSAYRLTGCSFQFMFGKIYSMFSAKVVFLVSLGVFEGGSLMCALAPTSTAFVVGRAVGGLGCAGILNGSFVVLTQCVPVRRRALYGALGGTAETAASVAGPLIGGLLTTKLNWRWCFWINLPIGAITCIIVFLFFHNPQVNPNEQLPLKEKIANLDLFGTLIFVPGIISLLLALQWGGTKYGWGNARIIALMFAFGIGVIAFGYLQYKKQDAATLPPRIVTQRSIIAGALFCSLCNGSLTVVDYYLPIYFQAVKEVSAARSGVLTLPTIIGLAVACLLAGTGITVVGYYTPFMLVSSIIAPIAAGLLTTIKVNQNLTSLVAYQVLLGFSFGLGIQAPQVAAQTTLSQADAPMGIAVIMFAQGLGPAVSASVAQSVFTGRLKSDLGKFAPALNSTSLENMGLADIKKYVGADNLEGALLGYDKAVAQTFYLPLAMMCASMIGALIMPWNSVKKKRE